MIFPSDVTEIILFLSSAKDLVSCKLTEALSWHSLPHGNLHFCFKEQHTNGLLDSLYTQKFSMPRRSGSTPVSSAQARGAKAAAEGGLGAPPAAALGYCNISSIYLTEVRLANKPGGISMPRTFLVGSSQFLPGTNVCAVLVPEARGCR